MNWFHSFAEHHFELSEREVELFSQFLSHFIEYNSHTNLSAIRDEASIIEKHFVDSLYGAPILSELGLAQGKLLDIGSGGGFPGIPLKIVCPDLQVTLLDSVGKKVRAMNHFIDALKLENIIALQERAEKLAEHTDHRNTYDVVISRATAYIDQILTWAKPFLKPHGKILLYKMPSDEETRTRDAILRKLGLVLEGEIFYILWEKERVIYVFSQKNEKTFDK